MTGQMEADELHPHNAMDSAKSNSKERYIRFLHGGKKEKGHYKYLTIEFTTKNECVKETSGEKSLKSKKLNYWILPTIFVHSEGRGSGNIETFNRTRHRDRDGLVARLEHKTRDALMLAAHHPRASRLEFRVDE